MVLIDITKTTIINIIHMDIVTMTNNQSQQVPATI